MSRFVVTFRSNLQIDSELSPKGEELAEYLHAALVSKSFQVAEVDVHEEFGWSIDLAPRGRAPWLLLGHVGAESYDWLCCVNSGVGWLGRLIGRSDHAERIRLAGAVHEVLTQAPVFSEIVWWKGAFGEGQGCSTPTG